MTKHLILASGSPRRKELLEHLQLAFTVIVSDIEEVIDSTLTPTEMVMSLAFQKASHVAKSYRGSYVIGADTIVVYRGQLFGKPRSEKEAISMLTLLSGGTHEVLTGVSILHGDQNCTFVERTNVTFWTLTEKEIYDYVKTGEPMDKAGAYGIQGLGSLLVKEIQGDYFSVVGLPIARTMRELRHLGLSK